MTPASMSSSENHASGSRLTNGSAATSQQQVNGGDHIAAQMPDASWYDTVRHRLSSQPIWPQASEEALLAPYNYLNANPGHGIRSVLIDTFDHWLKVPKEKLVCIDRAVQMAHTSSLMIDDIEDGSELRRGRPASHMVYGEPLTINAANYVYFLVFDEILKMTDLHISGHTPLVTSDQVQRMMVEEMLNLHRGQGIDLYWRDNFVCPTEHEYITMVNNKTGGLFRVVLKLMAGQSTRLKTVEEGNALVPLVNLIGLLYQIRDDYMNLRSGDYTQNKGYCEDLTEGKFSFPLIHALTVSKALDNPHQVVSNVDEMQKTNDSVQSMLSSASDLLQDDGKVFNDAHLGEAVYDSPLCPSSPKEPIAALSNESTFDIAKIDSHDDFIAALKSRPRDAQTKRSIVEYMQSRTGTFQYTCDVLIRVDRQVRHELRKLERMLDNGRPNHKLRAYVDLLRTGWYGGIDCPPLHDGKDSPPKQALQQKRQRME